MQIKEAMNFPVISRTGRTSAELQMIIDTLVLSSKTGSPFSITSIEAGKKYNSMQQRIRAQAKKLGFKIVIRFDSTSKSLFFKATRVEMNSAKSVDTGKLAVKTSEIAGVKTRVKTK